MELGPTTSHSGKGEQTMLQLLTAARKLFAEKGFRRTSVRDIANEARSNIAAVNYHFGSKENLYREVFRRHKLLARERGSAAVAEILEESGGKPTLESVLEAFSLASRKDRDPSDTRNWMMLIHRELVEPHLDAQFGLKEILEPFQQILSQAISAACPKIGEKSLRMCIHSFLAQLAHMDNLQVYFGNLDSKDIPLLDFDEAIRHIVRFTSAGINDAQNQENEPS
jgi:AcrR family transcriptional regulator